MIEINSFKKKQKFNTPISFNVLEQKIKEEY